MSCPDPLTDVIVQYRTLDPETGEPTTEVWQEVEGVTLEETPVTNNVAIRPVIPVALAEVRICIRVKGPRDLMFDVNSLASGDEFDRPLARYRVVYTERCAGHPLIVDTVNPEDPENHRTCRRIVAASFSADTPEGRRMRKATGHGETNKIKITLYCDMPEQETATRGLEGATRGIFSGSLMQGRQQAVNTSGVYHKDLRKCPPVAIVNVQFLFAAQMTKAPTQQDVASMFVDPEKICTKRKQGEEAVSDSPLKHPRTESDEEHPTSTERVDLFLGNSGVGSA